MERIIIKKRDGKKVGFDPKRITNAIIKAANASNGKMPNVVAITNNVLELIHKKTRENGNNCAVNISEVQSAVEESLMCAGHHKLATAYIEYRHERDLAREKQSELNLEVKSLIDQTDELLLNENANKDSKVIPTQRDLLAGIMAKHYSINQMLPRDVAQAHESGQIHYHDLHYAPFFPMFNCMLIDLKNMLSNGFKMGNADIETPRSIATATAVTAQIIAQVASHIYGGSTINNIDLILAPYVLKSYEKHKTTAVLYDIEDSGRYALKQTEQECYNAFQSLEYEINTLHTSNGQTPFVTFGFGLGTSWPEKLIQKCILKNRIAGLGKNRRTAIFPKLIYIIKDGLNRNIGDFNYDIKQLALECASKRMYPDILNYDQVVKATGSFKTPMGCRSFLSEYKENGVSVIDGRNNLGVVSINLPRVALEALEDESEFWRILDKRFLLIKSALLTRIQRLSNVKARVAPILYMEGACGVRLKADDCIASLFKNGRASISLGYIGINETINALFPLDETHLFDSKSKQKFALKIVQKLRDTVEQWKSETGYGFSLYSTPSENLCDRFCRIDKKEYGVVKGVTDKGYYTNSFHLDVEKQVNPYDKLDFEMEYPYISNGGFICFGEFPNLQHNLRALENIWDYSYNRVPYYATNTPIDECYKCGFAGEFDATSKGFVCPGCGNHDPETVSVTRRICGYLGSPDARPFNEGKQEEVKRRVKHL